MDLVTKYQLFIKDVKMGQEMVMDGCTIFDVNTVTIELWMLATQKQNVYIYVPTHKQATFVAVVT